MSPPNAVHASAQAFRRFFSELRETFLEREPLFTQLELALLCKEHLLVVGPPGTAKSAIASAVLSRITDAVTGASTLFSKQLSESTVQTDLIGPVDFKVLTETGRTEYLTDDGMLGATYAFLDEVFDGRDMLLRSILNVLHERELKHGRRFTAGRLETAILTSNRYLSEVLARSPELLLAFADRLSFVCFVPKSFANASSRAAMLSRSVKGQRPELRAELTVQQLDVLQDLVDRVQVPSLVVESLEVLADQLERLLQAQVARQPDYVPTKYFSQRSVVKALWALKAAVVRDAIWHHPERALEATDRDLEALRFFFLLGGPPAEETEALLKVAADPRERAQLEILRLEHRAFDEALGKVRAEAGNGVEREASSLGASSELALAESLARTYSPATATPLARSLRGKLVPGPRHAQNREPLLRAGRLLIGAAETRLGRGRSTPEARGGVVLLDSFLEVLELGRAVPQLHPVGDRLARQLLEYVGQSLELGCLAAESAEFDETIKLEGLLALATSLGEELVRLREALTALESVSSEEVATLRQREVQARGRVANALRRRASALFRSPSAPKPDFATLAADSRLGRLEERLRSLVPELPGLREELLGPLGADYVREVLQTAAFSRISQYTQAIGVMVETLQRQGLDPLPVLEQHRVVLERRLRAHASQMIPSAVTALPPVGVLLNGEAYSLYRTQLAGAQVLEGELASLGGLEGQLALQAGTLLSASVKETVASAEVTLLERRVGFLQGWLAALLETLPSPETIKDRAEAERAFDRLVKSRFPMLTLKEGELVRLDGALRPLTGHPGPAAEGALNLQRMLQQVAEDFGDYSRRLLQKRASL
ncbi:MAG: AAA family ATPase [Myxococcota bacterium]|nr:AAA family ATPase [Myxococcota bacterium]